MGGGFDIKLFNGAYAQQVQNAVSEAVDGEQVVDASQEDELLPVQERKEPGQVARELEKLMKSAVASEAGAVSVDDLKSVGKKSKSVRKNPAYQKALDLVANAQNQLDEVGKLTGRQLAEAFNAERGSAQDRDDLSKIRERVNRVITDQSKLSIELCTLIGATKNDDVKDALERMMLRADARVSELVTLVMQMTELAHGMSRGDPEHQVLLDDAASSLMSSMAGIMHGNDKAAAELAKDGEICAFLRDLEDLGHDLAALPKKGGRSKDGTPTVSQASLLERLTTMEERLRALNGTSGRLSAPIVWSLADALAAGRSRVENRNAVTTEKVRLQFHQTALGTLAQKFSKIRRGRVWRALAKTSEAAVADFSKTFDDLVEASRRYAKDPSPAQLKALKAANNAFVDRINLHSEGNGFYQALKMLYAQIKTPFKRQEILDVQADVSQDVLDEDERIIGNVSQGVYKNADAGADALFSSILMPYFTLYNRLDQMISVAPLQLTEEKFAQAFKEEGLSRADFERLVLDQPLSGKVEARVFGVDVTPEMCESECLDVYCDKVEPLGKGVANEVQLVSYTLPNGHQEQRVFKDELASYSSCIGLTLADNAWSKTQQIAKLNYAASQTAALLGTPHAVTKSTLGMCKGAFGLFMTRAPGKEAFETINVLETTSRADALADEEMKLLTDVRLHGYNSRNPSQRRLVGSLAKGLVELAWNDLLTGQGDRHRHNYFIGFQNGMALVTGIDNDMCFPAYKTGLTTFCAFDEDKLNAVQNAIYDASANGNAARALCENGLDKLPGAQKVSKGVAFKVQKDTPPLVRVGVMKGFGLKNGMALPPYMSRSMHDNLLRANTKKELKKVWKKTLGPDSYAAAVSRLEEMIALAKEYEKKGLVLEDDVEAWGEASVVKGLMSAPSLDTATDLTAKMKVEWKYTVTGSLLARDFGRIIKKVDGERLT